MKASNGGTYTWNGCDANGKKQLASGIYMVATATNMWKKGTVYQNSYYKVIMRQLTYVSYIKYGK